MAFVDDRVPDLPYNFSGSGAAPGAEQIWAAMKAWEDAHSQKISRGDGFRTPEPGAKDMTTWNPYMDSMPETRDYTKPNWWDQNSKDWGRGGFFDHLFSSFLPYRAGAGLVNFIGHWLGGRGDTYGGGDGSSGDAPVGDIFGGDYGYIPPEYQNRYDFEHRGDPGGLPTHSGHGSGGGGVGSGGPPDGGNNYYPPSGGGPGMGATYDWGYGATPTMLTGQQANPWMSGPGLAPMLAMMMSGGR